MLYAPTSSINHTNSYSNKSYIKICIFLGFLCNLCLFWWCGCILQIPGSIHQYNGAFSTLVEIGKHEGFKGLYRWEFPKWLLSIAMSCRANLPLFSFSKNVFLYRAGRRFTLGTLTVYPNQTKANQTVCSVPQSVLLATILYLKSALPKAILIDEFI